jgi:hypothetical protein
MVTVVRKDGPMICPSPDMIEAGASVLSERFGVVGAGPAAEEIAEEVFRAMMTKAGDSDQNQTDDPTTHSDEIG